MFLSGAVLEHEERDGVWRSFSVRLLWEVFVYVQPLRADRGRRPSFWSESTSLRVCLPLITLTQRVLLLHGRAGSVVIAVYSNTTITSL